MREITPEMQAKVDLETAEIKRLEALDYTSMSETEKAIHLTKIKDAYWRRRMATRTEDEVRRNVCAPG